MISGVFAIDQLAQRYLNNLSRNREQQLEQIGTAVITYLKSLKGTDLEPGEAIEWKGIDCSRFDSDYLRKKQC